MTYYCVYVLIPRYVQETERYCMSGRAGGCGRCGGSRVHAGSDLTLDSRARVRVHYTGSCTPPPPLSPCAQHSEHPSRSPCSIIALYELTAREKISPIYIINSIEDLKQNDTETYLIVSTTEELSRTEEYKKNVGPFSRDVIEPERIV